jgi:hypothetical protein
MYVREEVWDDASISHVEYHSIKKKDTKIR